jgi:hypothetical protein
MAITRAADLYYSYRFLKIMVTKWKDQEAYKLGIIDDDGKNLIRYKDLTTSEQRDAFTTFHRLVFNIKRILEKVPFGKSRVSSYAAALFLLREETGMAESTIIDALEELSVDSTGDLSEAAVLPGQYILSEEISLDFPKGYVVNVIGHHSTFIGVELYKTEENILITASNIR